jgi:hypothetical protein
MDRRKIKEDFSKILELSYQYCRTEYCGMKDLDEEIIDLARQINAKAYLVKKRVEQKVVT